ncbi:MAG: chemotaxis protein CheX [Nitrospirae bacterium]|nr:chemotaxis protein CheX [Nitrospirota bacterium]MBF0535956.1 chemotaxis protein CheX [Nitrospirota bacterium]MBF0618068.1 chemotaxis protein CheX [Nitrospirota bacterium]
MNVDFVNPFLESLVNILKTMANVEVTHNTPCIKADSSAMGYISGMIGLAGEKTSGSIAITFTEEAILHIASNMLGEKMTEVNEEIADMVGEITNMVSGGGRKILSEQGYKFNMAIPTTIVGKNHTITHKTKGMIVLVPFQTPAGPFYVEICFEEEKRKLEGAYSVKSKVIYRK